MANQQIWVHGNSGQLQVIDYGYDWGVGEPQGPGFLLVGNVQSPDNQNEPWLQFHIPMPSLAIEAERYLPKLRNVMVLFGTEYDSDADLGYEVDTGHQRPYKYVRDFGGAWIRQVHVYDGARRIFARDDLQWQSPHVQTPVEKTLTMPQDIEIRTGLGVSVRVRYKNQRRLEKYEQVGGSDQLVANFRPEDEPSNRTETKKAIIVAIGCEFVPAEP
ncbi:MAG: hypothetical protein HY664_06400 [Chloroflexi bacterium]|nr:hypothetical protein [Chloroflexota bacterium]